MQRFVVVVAYGDKEGVVFQAHLGSEMLVVILLLLANSHDVVFLLVRGEEIFLRREERGRGESPNPTMTKSQRTEHSKQLASRKPKSPQEDAWYYLYQHASRYQKDDCRH